MNVLRSLCSASLLLVWVSANARIPVKVETFPLNDVRLTQSPFKHAEDLDVRYLLGLDPDRLLAPYLKGAGLEPKADNYTNWENTGLDGVIYGAMPTGMESTIKLRIGDFLLTGVVFGNTAYKIGQEVKFEIGGEDILLFDRKSGKLITAGRLQV